MKYRLNTTNYWDFETVEVNKLPGRSYFIPYPDRKKADAVAPKEKRYASEKVLCLNGDWDFRFYPRPAELPAEFDTDAVSFDKIDVPSCWQFRGYDRPFYVNIRYQFPYDPPHIPTTDKVGKIFYILGADKGIGPRTVDPGEEYNFVGVYRRSITVEDPDRNYVISFLGVASCLDLYLNGKFIGYSEGAHNTAEFDLSGELVKGENELLAVVHRWCNGTYLEDQDMFRNNGLFRDVLLRVSEPTDIRDINARTEKHGGRYSLTLTANTYTDTDVTFTIRGHGLDETKTAAAVGGVAVVTFEDLDVTEWNAEDPTLYDIYYETKTACVKERIGFKTVEIRKDLFLVNGKRIKFKGVNHHDTSCTNGYTMTPDEIERDLLLCKEHNIDTVRTSHYPSDPLLLELADELGIYIVDENDLETHGTSVMQLKAPGDYNAISHDPAWLPRYMERIQRLYERDKVHANTSIVMWSLGNEAGGYHNTDAMYSWLKTKSALPVHYESAVHCKRIAYDVGSDMYPPVKKLRDIGEHKCKQAPMNDRPYFMCEYAHAMGVGPGNTEAYWQEIYRYDNLIGGCVWEMVDHAVLHADGTYTYGGDHGEYVHDGNFCVDGMFYPDRKPSAGAKIIKFIYRPIRLRHLFGDVFELFNTTAFSEGDRYRMTVTWNDGKKVDVPVTAGPLQKVRVTVPLGAEVNGTQIADVVVRDRKTDAVVSEGSLILKQEGIAAPATTSFPAGASVENGRFTLKLPNGKTLTTADEGTLLYRAGTDNDSIFGIYSNMPPYYGQKEKLKSCEKTAAGYKVVSEVKNRIAKYLVEDLYEGTDDGILVTSRIHKTIGVGTLPRFAKSFRLDESFDDVTYTARTGESYADMKEQFPVRTVSCKVADMTEPNLRPQESGNRCDCTSASVSDGSTTVTFEAVEKPYELNIKPYTDEALKHMKHREDEVRTGTYVTINAFQMGIGTGACGPGIAPEYKYSSDEAYELKFLIKC